MSIQLIFLENVDYKEYIVKTLIPSEKEIKYIPLLFFQNKNKNQELVVYKTMSGEYYFKFYVNKALKYNEGGKVNITEFIKQIKQYLFDSGIKFSLLWSDANDLFVKEYLKR